MSVLDASDLPIEHVNGSPAVTDIAVKFSMNFLSALLFVAVVFHFWHVVLSASK